MGVGFPKLSEVNESSEAHRKRVVVEVCVFETDSE